MTSKEVYKNSMHVYLRNPNRQPGKAQPLFVEWLSIFQNLLIQCPLQIIFLDWNCKEKYCQIDLFRLNYTNLFWFYTIPKTTMAIMNSYLLVSVFLIYAWSFTNFFKWQAYQYFGFKMQKNLSAGLEIYLNNLSFNNKHHWKLTTYSWRIECS